MDGCWRPAATKPAAGRIIQTHIFDWRTEGWSRGPDMAAGRWYPSVAALGNDEAVIIGGGAAVPEVSKRITHAAANRRQRLQRSGVSLLVPRPDGQTQLTPVLSQLAASGNQHFANVGCGVAARGSVNAVSTGPTDNINTISTAATGVIQRHGQHS
jgi:hypothetical protein